MLHLVLYSPQIPPNTGTIARLCLATRTQLHLIKPIGFSLDEHSLKRAGLDYWEHVNPVIHEHWEGFLDYKRQKGLSGKMYFASSKATRLYWDYSYQVGDFLIFGSETSGLPEVILKYYADTALKIPIDFQYVRSLNLAVSASIVTYEALRQIGFK